MCKDLNSTTEMKENTKMFFISPLKTAGFENKWNSVHHPGGLSYSC